MSDYPDQTEQTKNWCDRYQKLYDEMTVWRTMWQDIADYCYPNKSGINRKQYTPNNFAEPYLFDTTAHDAIMRGAAGFISWTTPKSAPWAEYTPILAQRNLDAVKNWLKECSRLAAEYLANSNFYEMRHESVLDKFTFGTGTLLSMVDDQGRTYFESLRIGSYVMDENSRGEVDTLMRKTYPMTARQAAQEFGEENLPECCKKALGDPGQADKKFDFLHVIEPRKNRKSGTYNTAENKLFVSAYVEMSSRKLVKEGGFDTFPAHPGRFGRWEMTDQRCVWGYGPGMTLLPEARQLNFMQKMMDVFAEKTVYPPLAAPESLRGQITTAPRGITYYAEGMNLGADSIRPIAVAGDWRVAVDRVQKRVDVIRQKAFLDLFEMLNGIDREMTAYEVRQRLTEKLDGITPAFDRDTTECIMPMMRRLFSLWAERGMLPPPPPEAMIDMEGRVPKPDVTMTSRLALAIQALSLQSADAQVQRALMVAQADPSVMDSLDLDYYIREGSRAAGCDPKIMRPLAEVQAMRAARAQAQQAQQAAMMLKEGSQAVRNVGGIDKVAQLMGGM